MTKPAERIPMSRAAAEMQRRLNLRFFRGEQCPFCSGDERHIEDNGCRGFELTYLCTACHKQWDAADYEEG